MSNIGIPLYISSPKSSNKVTIGMLLKLKFPLHVLLFSNYLVFEIVTFINGRLVFKETLLYVIERKYIYLKLKYMMNFSRHIKFLAHEHDIDRDKDCSIQLPTGQFSQSFAIMSNLHTNRYISLSGR